MVAAKNWLKGLKAAWKKNRKKRRNKWKRNNSQDFRRVYVEKSKKPASMAGPIFERKEFMTNVLFLSLKIAWS